MAYDNPTMSVTYSYDNQDPGAGSDIDKELIGPPGLKGKIKTIALNCNETYAGTTAGHNVCIGTAAGGTEYVNIVIVTSGGTAFTAGDAYVVDVEKGTANNIGAPGMTLTVTDDVLPADTAFYVSLQGGTGALTTGQCDLFVTVDWGNW